MLPSIPLIVRRVGAHEKDFVLATWKHELEVQRETRKWGRGLTDRDFWCLINHVIDRITFPSCIVFVGCHVDEPETPVCWIAIRRRAGLTTYSAIWLYARGTIRSDPEVAAAVQQALLHEVGRQFTLCSVEWGNFNPFLELRR